MILRGLLVDLCLPRVGTPPAGVILEAPFTNIIDAATSYPLSMVCYHALP